MRSKHPKFCKSFILSLDSVLAVAKEDVRYVEPSPDVYTFSVA